MGVETLVDTSDLNYAPYRREPVPGGALQRLGVTRLTYPGAQFGFHVEGSGSFRDAGYYMPEPFLDADKVISVPAMKTTIYGTTLAVKNYVGTLASGAYGDGTLQARALPEQPGARLRRPLRLQPARLLGHRGVLGHRGPRPPVGPQRPAQRRRRRLRSAGHGGDRQRRHGLRRPRPGGPLPGGGQGLRHPRPGADPGRGPRARERAAGLPQVGRRLGARVLLRPRHPPLAGGRALRGPPRGPRSTCPASRPCGPWRARPPAPTAGSAPSTSGTAPRSSISAGSPGRRTTRRATPSPSCTPAAIRRASCGWDSRSS